ncbi:MAG: hypothetical protein K5686_04545 [Lachnospiraceae bacterium]|nr:hypothetical protein [Lachnospiraceae bacterium]
MMKKPLTWAAYGIRHRLRCNERLVKKIPMCRSRKSIRSPEASLLLADKLKEGRPLLAGRMGLFETAAVRAYVFGRKKNYGLVMENLYNCAGFFPKDSAYLGKFSDCMTDCIKGTDIYAANREPMEAYLIDEYLPQGAALVGSIKLYDFFDPLINWTESLEGKKVLVVTSFPESVRQQYARREEIYKGSRKLPEFELLTYRPLMTIGDMRDERFETWFDGLEFMKREILALDFDTALISCGAYSYPLGLAVKQDGRQAVCAGGVLQILFGIMGRRWDGSRYGGAEHMDPKLKAWYNDSWIYPLEDKPADADRVEYGPYWK